MGAVAIATVVSRPPVQDADNAFCSVRWLRPFQQALREQSVDWPGRPSSRDAGSDLDQELEQLGLNATSFTETEVWLSHARVIEALERASRNTGERDLGLRAADCLAPGDFDILEYASATCATLGEAIQCASRLIQLVNTGAKLTVRVSGDRAALCYESGEAEGSAVSSEFVLASILKLGRRLTGMELIPEEVLFQHPAPSDQSLHRRVFMAPVRFGAAHDALIMLTSALDMPLPKPEPALHSILVRQATAMLERIPSRRTFKQQVLTLIAEELTHGNPGVENLAHRMDISARTFLRRLKREGTSHRELVTQARRSLALRYLESTEMSMAEISFVLGFSTSNSFHKAFRQWLGTTPASYRKRSSPSSVHARLD